MRILVADDSPVVRQRLVSLLAAIDPCMVVTGVRSAAEALATARDESPRLVVLDVRLSDRNAFEIVPQLKVLTPPPIVVVLTAHPTTRYEIESVRRGADYFFDKSREFDRVVQIARDLVDGQASRHLQGPGSRPTPSSR